MRLILIVILFMSFFERSYSQNTSEKLYNQAFELRIKKNFDEGLIAINKAIEIDPKVVKYYTFRANFLKSHYKEYDRAIEDFEKAISFGDSWYGKSEGYFDIGMCKYLKGDYYNAIAEFTKSIDLGGNLALFTGKNNYLYRGLCKAALKDFRGAILDYNRGNQKGSDQYLNYLHLGDAKYNLKDYTGSLSEYNKALALNKNSASVYFGIGISKVALGQKESGCINLSKSGEMGKKEAYSYIQKLCN